MNGHGETAASVSQRGRGLQANGRVHAVASACDMGVHEDTGADGRASQHNAMRPRGTSVCCAAVSQVALSTQRIALLGWATWRPMDATAVCSCWNAGLPTPGCPCRATSSWNAKPQAPSPGCSACSRENAGWRRKGGGPIGLPWLKSRLERVDAASSGAPLSHKHEWTP
jgi:hypothetical protein